MAQPKRSKDPKNGTRDGPISSKLKLKKIHDSAHRMSTVMAMRTRPTPNAEARYSMGRTGATKILSKFRVQTSSKNEMATPCWDRNMTSQKITPPNIHVNGPASATPILPSR